MTDTTYIATQTIQDIQSANSGFSWEDILNLLGLLLSPIIAVIVGQRLQDRKSKKDREYHNKFSIFIAVYGDRHLKGVSHTFNVAVNQIPVVFYDNQYIKSLYSEFIKEHKRVPFDREACHLCLLDLVQAMASDIGYKELNNSAINGFFLPSAEEDNNFVREISNYYYLKDNRQRYFDDLRKDQQQRLHEDQFPQQDQPVNP